MSVLRFYTSDAMHDVSVSAGHDPPRPALRPRTRRTALVSALGDPDGDIPSALYDGGIEATTPVRFVSSETEGFLTHAQVLALTALYEAGGAFLVDTDLLSPPGGATRTFEAVFQPGAAPEFPPAAHGQLWFLDVPLRVREVEA